MGLISAAIAFLEALEGPRTAGGHGEPPAAAAPAPRAPIDQQLISLSADVAGLKVEVQGLRGLIKEEADRADRASERTRKALARDRAQREGGEAEQLADEDVYEFNAGGSAASTVQPVRADVESAQRDFQAAARLAAARGLM